MKLKRLARTFLKVGKIINIILIPLFAVLLLVLSIIDIVAIVTATAAVADGADAQVLAGAIGALVGVIVTYTLLLVCVIVAFVLNKKASAILETAKSKAEAKPGAIMAIVAGALVTCFPIASGIMMLIMKDEDWTAEEVAE